jgi:hypothetical protein
MRDENDSAETIRLIGEVLLRHGGEALRNGAAAAEVAQGWLDAGFDDPEEVDAWLRARCFSATDAHALEVAGFTPEQAAILTRAGTASYEDTIGYKLARGDLSYDEARRIITSEFWNS